MEQVSEIERELSKEEQQHEEVSELNQMDSKEVVFIK